MDIKHKADERIIYLHELPSAHKLVSFIAFLDKKYNVDSSDPDNTFGQVNLDNTIIKHGVSNTAYFAGISRFGTNKLPKHTKLPSRSQVAIGISKKGDVQLFGDSYNIHQKLNTTPLELEPEDVNTLNKLRAEFQSELEENKPKEFKYDTSDKMTSTQYDELLTQQGFATEPLLKQFLVPLRSEYQTNPNKVKKAPFEIKYYRLGSNSSPHFTTSYDGWQNQEDMEYSDPCYQFYQKWDMFHLSPLTLDEYAEMLEDLNQLDSIK